MDKKGEITKASFDYTVKEEPPTLYTIPPLEWEGRHAFTLTGHYGVKEDEWYYYSETDAPGILHCPCTSIEDGKEKAEKHYMEQLGKCLEVYSG